MSLNRRFYQKISRLAHNGSPEARAALERIEARALDILAVVQAEHMIMKGWSDEDNRSDDSE